MIFKRMYDNPSMRFVTPVILEQLVTTFIGMVFSSIVGRISVSSLAAIGLVNTIMNVLTAISSFITTGCAVVTARLVGEGEYQGTSRAAEQSMLLGLLYGVAMMLLCELTSAPFMRLLLANSEESVVQEGLVFYRVMMLSYPFLSLFTTAGNLLRAAGDSRPAMFSTVFMNLVQIAAAYILIVRMNLGVIGAGMAYVVCRICGAAIMSAFILRSERGFRIRLRNVFRPDGEMIRRILRIGIPSSMEAISIQVCYLVMNSLSMSLGTLEAGANQVSETLSSLANIPSLTLLTISVTIVGQSLGAGDLEGARRSRRILHHSGLLIAFSLGLVTALLTPWLAPLFTKDPYIQQRTQQLMWVRLLFFLTAVSCNANDPILKTGGDVRFVMIANSVFAWLIRLPATLLFCFVFDMGAMGILLGNVISLAVRAVVGELRILKGKWLHIRV